MVARLGEDWVAYDGEKELMYEFNEVGGEILWAIQEGKTTEKEIVKALKAKFEVEEKEAKKDLKEFLAEMEDQGLVVR